MRFRSGIAVALVWAGSYSSDWTPSRRTSMCYGCGPKKTKDQKKKKKSTTVKVKAEASRVKHRAAIRVHSQRLLKL